MRLLFLDFDGVLHPLAPDSSSVELFCWLPVLTRLLEGHDDVRVVVHSTWRYEYTDSELRTLLGPVGHRFVGSAPRAPRQQAVEMVLQANKHSVRAHLVLDDDLKEFLGNTVNLLLVEPQTGLSHIRIQAALGAWLSSTSPLSGNDGSRSSGVD